MLFRSLEEAEKTEGETEIADALKAKANYLTKIGKKVCVCLDEYRLASEYSIKILM